MAKKGLILPVAIKDNCGWERIGQGCFILSDQDFVKNISQKFQGVGNRKITAYSSFRVYSRFRFDVAQILIIKSLWGSHLDCLWCTTCKRNKL
jgi:hypothetical protein